jgi:hypothetical protein
MGRKKKEKRERSSGVIPFADVYDSKSGLGNGG